MFEICATLLPPIFQRQTVVFNRILGNFRILFLQFFDDETVSAILACGLHTIFFNVVQEFCSLALKSSHPMTLKPCDYCVRNTDQK